MMNSIGRSNALLGALDNLSKLINASACMIIDERGLLISDCIKSDIDKNAMAILSSLLSGAGNKFIEKLNLKELDSVVINTPKGMFLIKDVPVSQLDRKFTLSIFFEKNGKMNKKQKSSKVSKFLAAFFKRSSPKKNGYLDQKLFSIVNQSVEEIQSIFLK
ncbi:MAG: hypothetical protein ACTSYF_09185 [Promethearchaeota archaeon]